MAITLDGTNGITLNGTTANIALGSNYISNGGTDAGLSLDSSNNATFSGNLTVVGALVAPGSFASGTKILFYQASAPTGWTAVAVNDRALRVVTAGTTGGTTGGSVAFSTAFSSQAVSGTIAGTAISPRRCQRTPTV